MEYNTGKTRLALPEYGRVVHEMVAHCMTLEDRDERNRCAATIINHMASIAPQRRDSSGSYSVFWDHLAIISDFKLDIDYPCEVIKPEEFAARPRKLPYAQDKMRYRHYGKVVENMVAQALELPQGEDRERFSLLIANQLKKAYLTWNKDTVSDRKIFDDLRELSSGEISLVEGTHKLVETRELLNLMRNNPPSSAPTASNNKKNNYRKRSR
ncbi:MAG: DUF4290 domain-containing protein [Tannerellaceae bacterium]|jgi:hypothetical protein|nr:DUF4290 domain-containing protein [Tannerellaceae bacterium]